MASNSRLTHSKTRRGDFGALAYKELHAVQAKLREASELLRRFGTIEDSNLFVFMASSYLRYGEGAGTGCQASPSPFASISCRPVKMRVFWLCPGQISSEAGYLTEV